MLRLSLIVRDYNEAMNAAVQAHGLVPDHFKWLHGEIRHPMEPQPILAPGPLTDWPWYVDAVAHDYFTSSLTVYGGKIANRAGDFRFGHIQGSICEPTSPGVKHQSNSTDPPVPYIERTLTINNGIVTVRTPEKDKPVDQGPVVFEGMTGHGRFATVTCYDPRSTDLTIRSGDFLTDGHGWSDDRTVAQNALQLPSGILEDRIATMARTLSAVTDILTKVAQQDGAQASWSYLLGHNPGPVSR
jgi:hypothetical protein